MSNYFSLNREAHKPGTLSRDTCNTKTSGLDGDRIIQCQDEEHWL